MWSTKNIQIDIVLSVVILPTFHTQKTYACPLQVSVLYCRPVGSSDKVMARCVKSQWPISLWSITYQPQSERYSNNIITKTMRHLRMMIKLQVGISVHASHDQLSIKRNQCMTIVELFSLYMSVYFVSTDSPSRGGDVAVYVWHKPTELAHSFLCCFCVCFFVFVALSTVFHSINFPENSPFSHSVLPVLSLPYWSFQLYISLWKSPSAVL